MAVLPEVLRKCYLQTVLVVMLSTVGDCTTYSDEIERLQTDVFQNYDKYVIPLNETNAPLTMYFGLAVNQIMDVDEKNQLITTRVWLNQYWTDYRLQWDPSNYSNIEFVTVPFEWFWYPDLVLENSGDGQQLLPTWKYATVYYYGEVWMVPPAKLVSPCSIDVTYFPFDHQTCPMSFGPWDFDANMIVLSPVLNYVPKENYIQNVEWTFDNQSTVNAFLDVDECCPLEAYSVIEFSLHIKRRPLFYMLNIVIPCIAFSFLTVFTFYMPSQSGEKITISISILISLSIFSLLVAEIMPATSETSPLIGSYLLFVIAVTAVSVIVTVIIINVSHRSSKQYPMKPWIRRLFLKTLPKYLLLGENFTTGDEPPWQTNLGKNSVRPLPCAADKDTLVEGVNFSEIDRKDDVQLINESIISNGHLSTITENIKMSPPKETEDKGCSNKLESNVLQFIEFQNERRQKKRRDDRITEEWKHLAIVVDRVCLIVFSVVMFIGSLAILCQRD
ncbi:acetylcholine receptor subunit alpha-like [Ptychodera flava]|uniref:acetylcholine receptor subunit alpha-like n=1 Tax=Ptychodera flava TaxID=63121 RepID=UPI00396A6FFF